MSQKKVPVKTAEGAMEIKSRVLGLAPRIRTALLLVDGTRSAVELERLMQAAGVTPGAMQLLLDKGLIRFPEDDRQDSVPSAAAPVTVPTMNVANVAAAGKTKPGGPPTLFLEPMAVPPVTLESKLPEPQAETAHQRKESPEVLSNEASPVTISPLEVMTLLEIETILGVATELEMETIIGVATKLEATPTQLLAPDTVIKAPPPVKAPPPEEWHLPQAQRAPRAAATVQKKVLPASILQMNLMVARAHVANALDQYLEIDGYMLKQRVAACESRAELEHLFRVVEAALIQRLEKPAAARIMGVAQALLER